MESNDYAKFHDAIKSYTKKNYPKLCTRKHKKCKKPHGGKLRVKKGFTNKRIKMQSGGGLLSFFTDLLGYGTTGKMARFKEFRKKYSKNMKHIEEELKKAEALGNIYKKYSEERLKVFEERIIAMRAIVIYPFLEDKIKSMIADEQKQAIEKAKKSGDKMPKPREYKSQLANAKDKINEMKQKKKSLEDKDATLYKLVGKHKKEFEIQFRKVQKFMDESTKVRDFYIKNVQKFVVELESLKGEVESYSSIPEKERSPQAKAAIKKFNRLKKKYDILNQFGAESKINVLGQIKDKLANLRSDMEHYNDEFENLSPGKLDDWAKKMNNVADLLSKIVKFVKQTKDKLKEINANIERLYEISSTQQIPSYMEKFKNFKEDALAVCIKAIGYVESQIIDLEQHFYNLVPANNLNFVTNTILTGLRTIFVILKDNVQKYINDDTTKVRFISSSI